MILCRRSTYNHLSSWLTDARNLINPNTVSWTFFSLKARLLLPEQEVGGSGQSTAVVSARAACVLLRCSCSHLQSAGIHFPYCSWSKRASSKSLLVPLTFQGLFEALGDKIGMKSGPTLTCVTPCFVSNEVNAVLRLECKLDLQQKLTRFCGGRFFWVSLPVSQSCCSACS